LHLRHEDGIIERSVWRHAVTANTGTSGPGEEKPPAEVGLPTSLEMSRIEHERQREAHQQDREWQRRTQVGAEAPGEFLGTSFWARVVVALGLLAAIAIAAGLIWLRIA
jgi:hypothetical protein